MFNYELRITGFFCVLLFPAGKDNKKIRLKTKKQLFFLLLPAGFFCRAVKIPHIPPPAPNVRQSAG